MINFLLVENYARKTGRCWAWCWAAPAACSRARARGERTTYCAWVQQPDRCMRRPLLEGGDLMTIANDLVPRALRPAVRPPPATSAACAVVHGPHCHGAAGTTTASRRPTSLSSSMQIRCAPGTPGRSAAGVLTPLEHRQAALDLFEATWEELVGKPSSTSASNAQQARRVCSGRPRGCTCLHCPVRAGRLGCSSQLRRAASHCAPQPEARGVGAASSRASCTWTLPSRPLQPSIPCRAPGTACWQTRRRRAWWTAAAGRGEP